MGQLAVYTCSGNLGEFAASSRTFATLSIQIENNNFSGKYVLVLILDYFVFLEGSWDFMGAACNVILQHFTWHC